MTFLACILAAGGVISIFVTQVRAQHRVKTKLHDEHLLR